MRFRVVGAPWLVRAVATAGTVVAALVTLAAASPLAAQTLQGRVTDDDDGRSVAVAIVRLLDTGDHPLALSLADSTGAYRLKTPGPGEYRVEVERLGYEPTRSPLLGVANPEGVYPVDLTMRRRPLGLEGLTVVRALPLGILATIVVVLPKETIAYPGGAILLYTADWLR